MQKKLEKVDSQGCQNGFIIYEVVCLLELDFFQINIKFEPFFVLLHAHMTSQSIRHPKLHNVMSKKCSNRTIFVDSRRILFFLGIVKTATFNFLIFYLKFEPFLSYHVFKRLLNESDTKITHERTKMDQTDTPPYKPLPFD